MPECLHHKICGLTDEADPTVGLCILHSHKVDKDPVAFTNALRVHRETQGARFAFIADFRSWKLTHNGQGQGYSKTTGRLRNHGIGRHPLSRAASRRMGLCARLSKRTTRRSVCT